MADLGDIVRDLAAVQDRLNALPPDAIGERAELRRRQRDLRDRAAEARGGADMEGTNEQLVAELANLRARLAAIEQTRIDVVKQHGGGSYAGPGADGWGADRMNKQIEAAAGVDQIRARIGRIKGLLIDRGVSPDEGVPR